MQKLMLSLSHGGTIKLIDNMCSSFDEEVLLWSMGQEAHFKVHVGVNCVECKLSIQDKC